MPGPENSNFVIVERVPGSGQGLKFTRDEANAFIAATPGAAIRPQGQGTLPEYEVDPYTGRARGRSVSGTGTGAMTVAQLRAEADRLEAEEAENAKRGPTPQTKLAPAPADKALGEMTITELREEAERRRVEVPAGPKEAIVAALESAGS